MKFKELQNMTEQPLQEKLVELQKELMKMNAQIAVGTVPKNPGQIKQTKKTIARIMHVLHTKHTAVKPAAAQKNNTRRAKE